MKIKLFLVITPLLFFAHTISAQTFTQIGSDIDGEAEGDYSGYSVSTNSDGSVVAIGAPHNDDNGIVAGHVRVYQYSNGNWIQIGSDIDGENGGDFSGWSVSLSSDGNTVAIGAFGNDGYGASSGHVRVYKNTNGSWIQLGSDINGEAADDQSGKSVSLSSDGSIVAIGAQSNDGRGSSAGHVRIYQYINENWTQLGSDIDGVRTYDNCGSAVSLSSDGNTVAIGAQGNDDNGDASGHVRVYQYISGIWTKLGSDIMGEATLDRSGYSASLSSDGNTVVIGAYGNDGNGSNAGHVRIYSYNNGKWSQVGSDIDGEAADDESGWSVSLSGDGKIVAIGAKGNDGNGSNAGHVRIYKNFNGTWTKIGSDIDGEAADDWSGSSVSLSSDGKTVAIGAYYNDGSKKNSGHVRVYNICSTNFTTETITACGSYTWTNGITYSESNNTARDTFVNAVGCDSIVTLNLTIKDSKFITQQPKDQALFVSNDASFELLTTSASSFTHQWQTDLGTGYQKLSDVGQYTGTQTKKLVIANITSTNNNQRFRCIVNDTYCSDTSEEAVLTTFGVGVNELQRNQILTYPNPVSDELNIEIESNLLGSPFKIINAIGQEIKQGNLTKLNTTIDINSLPKGSYTLLIGDEVPYSHAFLVE